MNSGELQMTPAQKDEQARAQDEMSDYWANEAPAMATVLQNLKTQPATQEIAAGKGAATGRDAAGNGMRTVDATAPGRGSQVGSGSFGSRVGGVLEKGSNFSGTGAASSRIAQVGGGLNKQAAAIDAGQGILTRADQALDVGAEIQAEQYKKNQQNKSQEMEDYANLVSQLGSSGSSMGGMSSMGSMGGGGAPAGGAGGGG